GWRSTSRRSWLARRWRYGSGQSRLMKWREVAGTRGGVGVADVAPRGVVGGALAVRLGPVAADEVAVVVRHQAGVGVDDDAARRIVEAWQLVERNEARPVELRRPARHRHRAVALTPDRHAGGRYQPDITRGVGVDHVLHRRDDAAGSTQELLPVLRQPEAAEALGRGVGATHTRRL